MRTLAIIVLWILSININIYAQKTPKTDSIYYLIDTTKTHLNDRMWDIHLEYPSLKIYIIQCPCLPYNHNPTFVYRFGEEKDHFFTKNILKKIKLISIVNLIKLTKQISSNTLNQKVDFFIIEPIGRQYTMRKVYLIKPSKPRNPSVDYENILPPDTVKH